MQAQIIVVGNEVLIGQVVDTNSGFIAISLNNIGISVVKIIIVQDNEKEIISALNNACEESDIVFITGGLGPTKDDLTKEALLQFFDDYLVENKKVLNHIQGMFQKKKIPFLEINRKQASVPSTCKVLFNIIGTAPGMMFKHSETLLFSLPGVPVEMKTLVENEVLPLLKKHFQLSCMLHKTVIIYGIPESVLANKIENWESSLPKGLILAYLPSSNFVRLRLNGSGENKKKLQEKIEYEFSKLKILLPGYVIDYDNGSALPVQVGEMLLENNQTISVAESCTGGELSRMLVSVSGASRYFKGSIVAYSKQVKIDQLYISESLIEKHSVVSAAVVEAMAKAAKRKFETDYAIATTGNAGPTSDQTDESVGVVFIGIATATSVYSKRLYLLSSRTNIIHQSARESLNFLKEIIQTKK